MPWLALAGLGAFHGLNPAMGWLFAVALGLHRGDRRAVWGALAPIALGHALSVAAVVSLVLLAGARVPMQMLRTGAGLLLIAWAAYHLLYGSRHRVRVGLRVGMLGLGFWSFTMATAHGAGLMLIPALMPLVEHAGHGHAVHVDLGASFPAALLAVLVHTGAMLLVTGAVAILVHDWLGLAFLRRGWINLDWVWSAALVATGLVLMSVA